MNNSKNQNQQKIFKNQMVNNSQRLADRQLPFDHGNRLFPDFSFSSPVDLPKDFHHRIRLH